LRRVPGGRPTLHLLRRAHDIFGYRLEDFEVRDYAPQAHIAAPVAV
jgi:thymidylate synthase